MLRPLAAAATLLIALPAAADKPVMRPPAPVPRVPYAPPEEKKEATPAPKPSPLKPVVDRLQATLAQAPAAKPEDVSSVDALVAALYDVISGPAGKPRDWQRFRSLFYPGAHMIPVNKNRPTPAPKALPITPDEYVTANSEHFAKKGFFEKELHRQMAGYGDVVNVLSAYETRETPGGEVTARGVNSIQVFFDGQRWWVLNIAWLDEKAAGMPVPKDFTRK